MRCKACNRKLSDHEKIKRELPIEVPKKKVVTKKKATITTTKKKKVATNEVQSLQQKVYKPIHL